MGFIFGKFPFVGWTRGWYAEDTENNYDSMASSLAINTTTVKESINSKLNKDLIKTVKGAFEMALLLKQNRYDQKVLYTKNED
jgi:hypothetical protein